MVDKKYDQLIDNVINLVGEKEIFWHSQIV